MADSYLIQLAYPTIALLALSYSGFAHRIYVSAMNSYKSHTEKRRERVELKREHPHFTGSDNFGIVLI